MYTQHTLCVCIRVGEGAGGWLSLSADVEFEKQQTALVKAVNDLIRGSQKLYFRSMFRNIPKIIIF